MRKTLKIINTVYGDATGGAGKLFWILQIR